MMSEGSRGCPTEQAVKLVKDGRSHRECFASGAVSVRQVRLDTA